MPYNKAQHRYVVHHKQLEQRMDGSSGGAFAALAETAAKEDYYFCGAVFDEQLAVRHIITNNPADIAKMAGYKPVASDYAQAFSQIKELAYSGSKVLFCGTPQQCLELREEGGDTENILLIDIINTPFIAKELLAKYAGEIEAEHQSKVKGIRFYDKEFHYNRSKRVTLDNGRTLFFHEEDNFDRLAASGSFTPADPSREAFKSLDERVGDITLGAYRMDDGDGLGYAYLSVNTPKGADLFAKARKRLTIVKEDHDITPRRVMFTAGHCNNHIDVSLLQSHSLAQLCAPQGGKRLKKKLKNLIRPFYAGFKFAKWNPLTYAKFLKMNFFTPGVCTSFRENGFVYITPHCAFKLVKGFQMELHGPLKIGTRRIGTSKQETRLRMEKGAKILVKKCCSFGAGSNVEIYRNALLEVGDISSNAELNIICGLHITTGDTCNIARNATIRDTSGHHIAIPGYKMARPVEIGNHTWICTESIIMPGVKIGDGAIVGARSYVAKSVPAFTLVQGSPAEPVAQPKYFRI